jgi:glucan phosphorylase
VTPGRRSRRRHESRGVLRWRQEAWALRYALNIPLDEIRPAHDLCKRSLMQEVNARANDGFDKDVLTIGFARRDTAYKRPLLIFKDQERLRSIARTLGGLQIVPRPPFEASGTSGMKAAHNGVPLMWRMTHLGVEEALCQTEFFSSWRVPRSRAHRRHR